MRKFLLIGIAMLTVSIPTFAGGFLTNTNQHPAFLRMLSRGATTEIDGAYYNPASLAFLPKDGFHVALVFRALSNENIDAAFSTHTTVLTGRNPLFRRSLSRSIMKKAAALQLSPVCLQPIER